MADESTKEDLVLSKEDLVLSKEDLVRTKELTASQIMYKKYRHHYIASRKKFYNKNKEVIKSLAREKYNNDPDYRNKKIEQMALYRAKKKAERLEKKNKEGLAPLQESLVKNL